MKAREFKEKWHLTQDQVAKLLGVTRSTVSHWTMADGGEEPDSVKKQISVIDSAFSLLELLEQCRIRHPELIEVFEESADRRKKRKK